MNPACAVLIANAVSDVSIDFFMMVLIVYYK